MNLFKKKKKREKSASAYWLTSPEAYDTLCISGYTPLDHNPEIMAACYKIASIIASATIHLMQNTADGDKRLQNELSRKIDINPMRNMTRQTWMTGIVMTMLLYGRGNAVVVPHTERGLLADLEPIAASRVTLQPIMNSYTDYRVVIDGSREMDPNNVLHFVYNPDENYLWKGRGMTVNLQTVAENLKQAAKTENAFMKSEYKPSLIVSVDALTDEFASPEGRKKLIESYVNPATPGEPWMIPAEQMSVQQVKPLTLADLAIADTVTLDKKAVASILGVPAFILGVGEYSAAEWNYFISTTIMNLAKNIAAEMTRKLILSPDWYLTFNIWSLLDYDIEKVSSIMLAGSDRGFVCGDEWRDRVHLSPVGLKEYKVLENYIPADMSGKQKKLVQEGD